LAESWDMAYILAFQLAVAACLDNEYVSAHLYVCYYYFFAFKFIVTRICIIQCVIKLVVFFTNLLRNDWFSVYFLADTSRLAKLNYC